MKQLLFLCLLTGLFWQCKSPVQSSVQPGISSSAALIQAMHDQYKGKWFDQFTFVQQTIQFDSTGQPTDTSTWYEAIDYPKKFRIDYGPLSAGNAVIFDKDSVWVFKAGAFTKKAYAPREFLLMKGGLYHLSIQETIQQLESYGYATNKFHVTDYKGNPVYVIGAEKGDLTSKQFWLDATHFYMIRRISPAKGKTLDVIYSKHLQQNGGWVEQEVDFWLDGKYIQKEYYQQIDTDPKLSSAIFDYRAFGKEHWFKKE